MRRDHANATCPRFARARVRRRDDGKRFIVRAEEILTAFLELERAIHHFAESLVA